MTYLVRWRCTIHVPTSCPDRVIDPYTGEQNMMACLVYHTKQEIQDRSQEFDTKEEAEEFVLHAPASCTDMYTQEISTN